MTVQTRRAQFERALEALVIAVDRLVLALGCSTRVVEVLEPYRMKCAYVRQRLLNTRNGVAEGYRGVDGLLADLAQMGEALLREPG